jgi:hypothetical protein
MDDGPAVDLPSAPGPRRTDWKASDPVMNLPWTHAGMPALNLRGRRVTSALGRNWSVATGRTSFSGRAGSSKSLRELTSPVQSARCHYDSLVLCLEGCSGCQTSSTPAWSCDAAAAACWLQRLLLDSVVAGRTTC